MGGSFRELHVKEAAEENLCLVNDWDALVWWRLGQGPGLYLLLPSLEGVTRTAQGEGDDDEGACG